MLLSIPLSVFCRAQSIAFAVLLVMSFHGRAAPSVSILGNKITFSPYNILSNASVISKFCLPFLTAGLSEGANANGANKIGRYNLSQATNEAAIENQILHKNDENCNQALNELLECYNKYFATTSTPKLDDESSYPTGVVVSLTICGAGLIAMSMATHEVLQFIKQQKKATSEQEKLKQHYP